MVLCGQLNFIQDDSYISLVYARNFVNGHGLVFNSGEQVEGYTSFTWILILSIPYLIKINPVIFAKVMSICFGAGVLIVTYLVNNLLLRRVSSKIRKFSYISYIPVFLLVISGTFYYWTVSGMETTFYTFLCMLGIYYYLKRSERAQNNIIAIIILTLAFLTRQEAVIFIFIFFLNLLLDQLKKSNWKISAKSVFTDELVTPLLIFLIPASLFIAFRLIYYGYPFPNTFYAKTGLSSEYLEQGLQYTVSFFKIYLFYGAVFIAPSILFRERSIQKETALLYTLIILYIIYVIQVGGDVLALHRFFIPIMPFIYIMFTLFLIYTYKFISKITAGRLASYTGLTLLILLISVKIYSGSHDNALRKSRSEKGLTYSMASIAGAITKETGADELLLATSTIGALKYYSNADVLDMLGLTDKFIAHNPSPDAIIAGYNTGWKEKNFNTGYVLSRNPDYIIFSTNEKPSSAAERALFLEKDFYRKYFVYPVFTDTTGIPRNIYKRRQQDQFLSSDQLEQWNENYSPPFINIYNQLLNNIKRRSYLTDFERTKEIYDSLVKTCPTYFAEPYRFMGQVYYNMRDYNAALDYTSKCLAIDSLNIYSRVLQYRIGNELGLNELALSQVSFLREHFPEILIQRKFMNETGL